MVGTFAFILAQTTTLAGMSPETVFGIASNLVLPGWLLLIFLPRWKVTKWLVHSGVLSAVLALFYLGIVAPSMARGELDFKDFGSLAGVTSLFQNPWVLVGGWIHYLAFDLMIGAWEVRDSKRVGVHHLLVIPCLFLTFMLGPVGMLCYLVLRWSITRRFEVE